MLDASITANLAALPDGAWKLHPEHPVVQQLHEKEHAWESAHVLHNDIGRDLGALNRDLAEMAIQLRDAKRAQAEADWRTWRAGSPLAKSSLLSLAERFTRLTAINDYLGSAAMAARTAANAATADLLDARAELLETVVNLWHGEAVKRVSASIGTMPGMDDFKLQPKSREIQTMETLSIRLRQAARAIQQNPDASYTGEVPLTIDWDDLFLNGGE